MGDWLDDLVSTAKTKYEEQRATDARLARQQELKKALGKQFYEDLEKWFQRSVETFNLKFGQRVLAYYDGPLMSFSITSTSRSNGTTDVTYEPDTHNIEVRLPGELPVRYCFSLTDNDARVVLLSEANTDPNRGFTPETLGQKVLKEMLLG